MKVADGPERLTVAQVDALLYLPNKSRALLERALRIPALSEGWKGSFRELLAKHESPPAWPGFRPLKVTAIRRESATIRSFTFAPTDGTPAHASPGQYLTLRLGRPGSSAATRSPTSPTGTATGSASSARAPAASSCTTA